MKPDISFVLKSGHFHLLTTLTGWRQSSRNSQDGTESELETCLRLFSSTQDHDLGHKCLSVPQKYFRRRLIRLNFVRDLGAKECHKRPIRL